MLELERRDDVRPVCPYCERELSDVWYQEIRGMLGKRYVYLCSTCRKVLGFSHRKGFWMG